MKNSSWLGIVIALILGVGIGWYIGTSQPAYQSSTESTPALSSSSEATELRFNMRKLWEDHILWTRLYLDSAILGAGDPETILERLMQNQEDIGNAIKPYYGEEAGDQLTSLLRDHISLAGEVVSAAVAADVAGLKTADDQWHANGNEIADLLSAANPNWPNEEMRAMMNDHLNLTRQEAVDIIAKRTDASIADYDKVHNQILQMADMLSDGIIKQYPDAF